MSKSERLLTSLLAGFCVVTLAIVVAGTSSAVADETTASPGDITAICAENAIASKVNANFTGSSGKLKIQNSGDKLADVKCIWIVTNSNKSFEKYWIHLRINSLLLNEGDTLTVNDSKNTTLLTLGSDTSPGTVFTGSKNVTIILQLANVSVSREFDLFYDFGDNNDHVQDIRSAGSFHVGYSHSQPQPDKLEFFTVYFDIYDNLANDYYLWLSLDAKLNKEAQISIINSQNADNKAYDGRDVLSSEGKNNLIVNITKLQINKDSPGGVTFYYDLVNKKCSKYINSGELAIDHCQSLQIPDDLKTLSSFKCLYLLEHQRRDVKLNVNLSNLKLLNALDTLVVKDGQSKWNTSIAEVSYTEPFIQWWRQQYIFSTSNQLWALISSPKVINKQKPERTDACVTEMLFGGCLQPGNSLDVKKSDELNKLLPVVFTMASWGKNKQAAVTFDTTQTLVGQPGQPLLSFYNSIDKDDTIPFAKLYSGDLPPSVLAYGQVLRIEVNQSVALSKVVATEIDAGCSSTVKGSSDVFSPSVCKDECSWFIPKSRNNNGSCIIDITLLNLVTSDDQLILNKLSNKIEALLNLKGPLQTAAFPNIVLSPDFSYQLTLKRPKCDAQNRNALSTSYLHLNELELTQNSTISGVNTTISSLNYPNFYPILSDQLWNVNFSKPILLTFSDIQLAPGHQLILKSNDVQSDTQTFNENSKLPSDFLFKTSPFFIKLVTSKTETPPFSSRGFALNITQFDDGEALNVSSHSLLTPGFPEKVVNKTRFIWRVAVPKQPNGTMNIISFDVSYGKDGDEKNSELIIYDSDTLRNIRRVNGNVSSVDSVLVTYSVKDPKKAFRGLNLTFTSKACTDFCHNGRCILPQWKCNNVNDCGDWTDEFLCNGTSPEPTPPPQPPAPVVHQGVNGWLVLLFICPLCICIGAAGTIFGPPLIRRLRGGRYTEFQDFSEVS